MIFTVNMLGIFLSRTKNVLQVPIHLKKCLVESGRKPYQTWLDQGKEFYKMKENLLLLRDLLRL